MSEDPYWRRSLLTKSFAQLSFPNVESTTTDSETNNNNVVGDSSDDEITDKHDKKV